MENRQKVIAQFPKHVLPIEQPVIVTPPMQEAFGYGTRVLEKKKERGQDRLGIIYGNEGTSKTSFSLNLVLESEILPHTGLPPVLYFKIFNGMNPLLLIKIIMGLFEEGVESGNPYSLVPQVSRQLALNSISLILLDGGEHINFDLLDFLIYLNEYSSSAIILLGRSNLFSEISNSNSSSYIYAPFELRALTENEVINEYLPNLNLPKWKFNPADVDDKKIGTELWKRVSPNLRKLQTILEDALEVAEVKKSKWITPEIIRDALNVSKWNLNNIPSSDAKNVQDKGHFEAQSEARQEAKTMRRK